jgi:integrase
MSLSDLKIRAAIKTAQREQRVVRLRDGRGLWLHVTERGSSLRRFRHRFSGLAKMISLGIYPDVPLATARKRLDEARRLVADDIDPSAKRKAEKLARADTLRAISEEYFAQHADRLSTDTLVRDRQAFGKLLPSLGSRPITDIRAPDLLTALRRIQPSGLYSTHRAKQIYGRIARYAIATGRAERDVAADLKGALPAPVETSFAAIIEPGRVGELLRAIQGYDGQAVTVAALKLLPYVFCRPGELRGMLWAELEDLDGKEPLWRIPKERMKMDREHLVPLSRQAVAILHWLRPLTGEGALVFPSLRSATRPISDNTLNAALRRLGYNGDEQTSHGFRSIASTLLNERGFAPDLIELQLAHRDSSVRAIYNRSVRLQERRQMMQAWADYLDGLKAAVRHK